ncbi:MAG: hypothetical protein ACRDD1_06170, partial [Planctomycetia bacterium]
GLGDADYRQMRDWVHHISDRWNADVAGLPPPELEGNEADFGADRRQPRIVVDTTRLSRPGRPDDAPTVTRRDLGVAGRQRPALPESALRGSAADDAPEDPPRSKPIPRGAPKESAPEADEPSEYGSEAPERPVADDVKPTASDDPFDPAAFNRRSTAKPKLDPRNALPTSVPLTTDKRGEVFKAAPLPFNPRRR